MGKQNFIQKQGVIAIIDISLYTIENGKLKALDKKSTEEKLRHSVLSSLNKINSENKIPKNDSEDEIDYLNINL